MSTPEPLLRRTLVHWLTKVDAKGWVANHDGNLTLRLPGGRLLATPTATAKSEVREADLLVLAPDGRVLSGRRRAFGELSLHRAAYEARPDVGAVLHAHPPHATAFAVSGRTFDPRIIAEAVVSLGDALPLIPYDLPGAAVQLEAVGAALTNHDALLLESHGVLTVGVDVEQAFLRMELVEHLARIHWLALPLGGARLLPEADVQRLLQARTRAGLGPAARAAS